MTEGGSVRSFATRHTHISSPSHRILGDLQGNEFTKEETRGLKSETKAS